MANGALDQDLGLAFQMTQHPTHSLRELFHRGARPIQDRHRQVIQARLSLHRVSGKLGGQVQDGIDPSFGKQPALPREKTSSNQDASLEVGDRRLSADKPEDKEISVPAGDEGEKEHQCKGMEGPMAVLEKKPSASPSKRVGHIGYTHQQG